MSQNASNPIDNIILVWTYSSIRRRCANYVSGCITGTNQWIYNSGHVFSCCLAMYILHWMYMYMFPNIQASTSTVRPSCWRWSTSIHRDIIREVNTCAKHWESVLLSKCKNLFYRVVRAHNDLKNSKKPNHIGIGGATGKGVRCSLKPNWYRDEEKKACSTTQKCKSVYG